MSRATLPMHGERHRISQRLDGSFVDGGPDPIPGLAAALNAPTSEPVPRLPRFVRASALGEVDTTLNGDNPSEAGGPWLPTEKWVIKTNDRTGSVETIDSDYATWTGDVFEVVGGSGANRNAIRLRKDAPPGIVLWWISGEIDAFQSAVTVDEFGFAAGLEAGTEIGDMPFPGDGIFQGGFGDDSYAAPLRKYHDQTPPPYVAFGSGAGLLYAGTSGAWTIHPDFVQSSGVTCTVDVAFAAVHLSDWGAGDVPSIDWDGGGP